MIKKELMIKAHKLTKEIKAEFAEVNYSFQLGLCMSYLAKEGDNKEMVELIGSEKQIAWANEIMEEVITTYTNIETLLNTTEMPEELRVLFLNPVVESKGLVLKITKADKVISAFKDIIYLKTNSKKVKFILSKINCGRFQPANGFLGTVKGNQRTNDLENNVEEYFA